MYWRQLLHRRWGKAVWCHCDWPYTAIGANAVVNRSFPQGNVTIGGVPAEKISDKSAARLLIKGHDDGAQN